MTTFEGTDQFSSMSDAQQIRFLAHYAHKLTVVSRGTYEVSTEDLADPRRLRHFNEVQHRVVGHIVKLLAKDTKGYPDDVLVKIMLNESEPPLLACFERALEYSS